MPAVLVTHAVLYLTLFCLVWLLVYGMLPLVADRLIRRLVIQAYATFCDDTQTKMKEHMQAGQKMLIPTGQAMVIGHLIEPYLEKLGNWMMTKINEHGHERVVNACTKMCLNYVLRWRLVIALSCAQMFTGLLALGYLLKGTI